MSVPVGFHLGYIFVSDEITFPLGSRGGVVMLGFYECSTEHIYI